METTQNRGVWPVNTQPSSLIVNFFAITDIVKNEGKITSLLNRVNKAISDCGKSPLSPLSPGNSTITIPDHGLNWVFDITIDFNGNYGLLFTGLEK